jgi:uncharacterized lipoprotein YmbA
VKALLTAVCALSLLSACATSRPDHFYILSVQPPGANEARTAPPTLVTLKVTLPTLVDRSEMILNTSMDGVIILEHERWAAPPTDLVTQTLARDLERRRADLLVVDPNVNRPSAADIKIAVDVVQMTARRGGRASIETHWRILDAHTGKDVLGGDVFSAPLGQDGYAGVAQALSECLALVADRLVGQMR